MANKRPEVQGAKERYKAKPLKEVMNADVWHTSYGELELMAMRRQLAKTTNQRMVRLERSASKITGERYDYGAVEIAKEYLMEHGGKKRFTEKLDVDMDTNELKREISAMQKFLNSKSSTVKGMRDIEKSRVKTFVDKGLDESVVTDRDFYNFLSSETFKSLAKTFDSETIVDMYDARRRKGADHDDIMKSLDDYLKEENQSAKGLAESFMEADAGESKEERSKALSLLLKLI